MREGTVTRPRLFGLAGEQFDARRQGHARDEVLVEPQSLKIEEFWEELVDGRRVARSYTNLKVMDVVPDIVLFDASPENGQDTCAKGALGTFTCQVQRIKFCGTRPVFNEH